MTNNLKVFLLTPVAPLEKKIVWADNDDDARSIAGLCMLKRKEPHSDACMNNNNPYLDPMTTCEEITSLVEDIQQFNNSTIHFRYLGSQIHLGKGKAELLNKFQNPE